MEAAADGGGATLRARFEGVGRPRPGVRCQRSASIPASRPTGRVDRPGFEVEVARSPHSPQAGAANDGAPRNDEGLWRPESGSWRAAPLPGAHSDPYHSVPLRPDGSKMLPARSTVREGRMLRYLGLAVCFCLSTLVFAGFAAKANGPAVADETVAEASGDALNTLAVQEAKPAASCWTNTCEWRSRCQNNGSWHDNYKVKYCFNICTHSFESTGQRCCWTSSPGHC
jgi:hypothetical protein